MEEFNTLFNQIGPWAVVVFSLVWLAYFAKEQIADARAERKESEERHTEEVNKLSEAIGTQSERMSEVIQNNTEALIRLTSLVEKSQ